MVQNVSGSASAFVTRMHIRSRTLPPTLALRRSENLLVYSLSPDVSLVTAQPAMARNGPQPPLVAWLHMQEYLGVNEVNQGPRRTSSHRANRHHLQTLKHLAVGAAVLAQ